jgi:uncharacterized protein YbjT (DUF2867 family)
MTAPRLFVAGATGYTGRALVETARARGIEVVAHVRPDSARLDQWRARFEEMGATVDASPWTAEAITTTLAQHQPTHVFGLLGTTRARAGQGLGSAVPETYEAVDYGLTAMLIDAAATLTPPPRFVYLSAAGVSPTTRNAYLAARAKVEAKLANSGLRHVIARPGLITGDDRDEARTGERVGAVIMKGLSALGGVAGFGGVLHRRYATMTGAQLAMGLLVCTLRNDQESTMRVELEAGALKKASEPGSA